ncbi:TlpA family protein disulfide reductase [Merdibacter massiliensis]|uniref:TlpA family protein disulfide reductase n=1 Tax=Merdibacter massiliensis TaxID=1871030 RepID=UPI00096A51AA|nr:hypothetical protein [Merdibacter massiliensis]
MKKIMILLIAIFMCGCSAQGNDACPEKMLEQEGERADMSAYGTLTDQEHVFYEKTMEDVLSIFENKQSAIVYFGYVGCPWCAEAIPIMDEVAKAKGLTICYAPTYDGEKYTLQGDIRNKIFSYLNDFLSEDDDGNKAMYVPFVVVIKDGTVVSAHEGTVSTHNAHERVMNDSEIIELTNIYQDMFDALVCNN